MPCSSNNSIASHSRGRDGKEEAINGSVGTSRSFAKVTICSIIVDGCRCTCSGPTFGYALVPLMDAVENLHSHRSRYDNAFVILENVIDDS